jgi:hypothetical protein
MAYNLGKPIPTRRAVDLSGVKQMWRDPVDLTGIQSMWSEATKDALTTGTPKASSGTGIDFAGTGNRLKSLVPYGSNIVNLLRKPPMPKRGQKFSYTNLQKINLSNERNQLAVSTNAANRATERNVDANTAEAVKAFNRGDEFAKMSSINERESNTNAGISNQQAQMDASVSAANTGLENKYRDELVERNVAHQREQSANIANAGDKAVMIHNEDQKRQTELSKARVLRGIYGKSGVLSRDNAIGQEWKKAGIPDPFGEDYGWLNKKADGGFIGDPDPRALSMRPTGVDNTGMMRKIPVSSNPVLQDRIQAREGRFTTMFKNPNATVAVPGGSTIPGDSTRYYTGQAGRLGVPYTIDKIGVKGFSTQSPGTFLNMDPSKMRVYSDSARYNANFKYGGKMKVPKRKVTY